MTTRRRTSSAKIRASSRMAVVLPTPGRPSSRMDCPSVAMSRMSSALPAMLRPTRAVRPTMRPARLRMQLTRWRVRSTPARLSAPNSPHAQTACSSWLRVSTSAERGASSPLGNLAKGTRPRSSTSSSSSPRCGWSSRVWRRGPGRRTSRRSNSATAATAAGAHTSPPLGLPRAASAARAARALASGSSWLSAAAAARHSAPHARRSQAGARCLTALHLAALHRSVVAEQHAAPGRRAAGGMSSPERHQSVSLLLTPLAVALAVLTPPVEEHTFLYSSYDRRFRCLPRRTTSVGRRRVERRRVDDFSSHTLPPVSLCVSQVPTWLPWAPTGTTGSTPAPCGPRRAVGMQTREAGAATRCSPTAQWPSSPTS